MNALRFAALGLVLLGVLADSSQADTLNVDIQSSGPQAFQEATVQSGQVIWSTTDQGLVIPPSNYDVYLRFEIIIEADTDNVPVDPSVSVLSLIGWPTEFPQTLTWDFDLMSSAVDGPLNTWIWSTGVTFRSGLTLDPEEVIATADWGTSGNDIDDFPDNGSFAFSASVSVVHMIPTESLMTVIASDSKLLNPEPVPEPSLLIILAGGWVLLPRKKNSR